MINKKYLKKSTSLLLVFTLVGTMFVGLFAGTEMFVMKTAAASGSFGGGDGTAGNPYIIEDVWDLQNMSADLSAHYVLGKDIDASATSGWDGGAGFYPIGGDFLNPFIGSLDGRGYAISNLTINRSAKEYIGLFGYVGAAGSVTNLSLVDANVSGYQYVGGFVGLNSGQLKYSSSSGEVLRTLSSDENYYGGFVGLNYNGLIYDCQSDTDLNISGGNRVGGFAGYNYGGIITNCSSTGDVIGKGRVGGFVGENRGTIKNSSSTGNTTQLGNNYAGGFVAYNYASSADIENCYSTGDVFGNGDHVGGFSAYNNGNLMTSYSTGNARGDTTSDYIGGFTGRNTGTITNCYSTGNASGGSDVGGFIGQNSDTITTSYSTGNASGGSNVGGFAGDNSGIIIGCFWDNDTSGSDDGVGSADPDPVGVQGKYTTDMMQQATFINWDFTNIWGIYEYNTYPFLQALGSTYVPSADLGLTIESSSYQIARKGSFVYIYVNVTNNGPNITSNVNVTVTGAGADVELNSANQTLVLRDSGASWYPSLLRPGETACLLVNLTANESGMFYLNGTSTSDVEDLVPSNNNDSIILSINAAPIAANDPNKIIDEDSGPLNMNVLLNDNDPDGGDLTVISVTQGVHGTVEIIDAGKNVTYEPDLNWNGNDWFNYTISDEWGVTDTATVNITVLPINDATVAVNDTFAVAEDSGANTLDVLANDYDIENDTITVTIIGSYPLNGTVQITPGGLSINYTPNANFNGVDSFTYQTTGNSNYATVNLIITPVNDAPVISTTDVTTAKVSIPYMVDYNATDIEADTMTWSLSTNGTWLSIDASTGVLNGTPTTPGVYWVNVTVSDGNGGLDWTNFTISVVGEPAPIDTDGDGVPDYQDAFPNDANETTDTDGDGVGDNADLFPYDANETTDSDGDGVGDNADDFPTDPAASLDADHDGLPDRWNDGYTASDSTTGLKLDDDPTAPYEAVDNAESGFGDYLWIGIIMVVVIVIALAAFMMKGRGKTLEEMPEKMKEEGTSREGSNTPSEEKNGAAGE